jgi:hypothetical protein
MTHNDESVPESVRTHPWYKGTKSLMDALDKKYGRDNVVRYFDNRLRGVPQKEAAEDADKAFPRPKPAAAHAKAGTALPLDDTGIRQGTCRVQPRPSPSMR